MKDKKYFVVVDQKDMVNQNEIYDGTDYRKALNALRQIEVGYIERFDNQIAAQYGDNGFISRTKGWQ